jgi:hypothetical protein
MDYMVAIYNGAIATIIDGVGQNSDAPLAGVRSGIREPEKQRLKYHNAYLIEPGVEDRVLFRRPLDNTAYAYLGQRVRAR